LKKRKAELDIDDNKMSSTLWVGNVCQTISPTEFRNSFEQCGEIKQVRMFPGSKCAFITYARPEDAITAEKKWQGQKLGTLEMKISIGKATKSLWVGNVGPGCTAEIFVMNLRKSARLVILKF
jgi:RNA recognition motif-containing protein